jgi:hypothetical protein
MRATTVTLALLLAAGWLLAAAPSTALGAASGAVTPPSGAPGATFTVNVSGLTPGEEAGSWLTRPDGRAIDATPYLKADGQGSVSWTWTSPADAQAGVWQAVTRGEKSRAEVVASFIITGDNPAPVAPPSPARGSVSPASGGPGTTFSFSLEGFRRTEKVAYWPTQPDGTVEATRREPISTDGDGRATLAWQAPAQAQSGSWVMTFEGLTSGRVLQIGFAIAASPAAQASVSPASGAPGTTFSFQAGGFNVIERIDTWLERPDGTAQLGPAEVRADGNGLAAWAWTAPADAPGGAWTMVARGQDSDRTYRIGFSIVRGDAPPAAASVTPAEGPPGTAFTFSASGYEYGERVGYWLNLPDGTIQPFNHELRADKEGRVTWSYTAPADAPRGLYVMAARSSQSDDVDNDVSHALRFTVTP